MTAATKRKPRYDKVPASDVVEGDWVTCDTGSVREVTVVIVASGSVSIGLNGEGKHERTMLCDPSEIVHKHPTPEETS